MNTPFRFFLLSRMFVKFICFCIVCILPSVIFAQSDHASLDGVNASFAMGVPAHPSPAPFHGLAEATTQIAGFAVQDYQIKDDHGGGHGGGGSGGGHQGGGAHGAGSVGSSHAMTTTTSSGGGGSKHVSSGGMGSSGGYGHGDHKGHGEHYGEHRGGHRQHGGGVVVGTEGGYDVGYPRTVVFETRVESEEVDKEPAIMLANRDNESFIKVWVTLNPSIKSDSSQEEKYTDLWGGVPNLIYVDTITNADFTANGNALCLIDWSVQDFINVVYKVYHSPDPNNDEPILLYSGYNNYYYISNDILAPGVQDYIWVEVFTQNGDWIAESAEIPLRP